MYIYIFIILEIFLRSWTPNVAAQFKEMRTPEQGPYLCWNWEPTILRAAQGRGRSAKELLADRVGASHVTDAGVVSCRTLP